MPCQVAFALEACITTIEQARSVLVATAVGLPSLVDLSLMHCFVVLSGERSGTQGAAERLVSVMRLLVISKNGGPSQVLLARRAFMLAFVGRHL